jgi:hypothetical protein
MDMEISVQYVARNHTYWTAGDQQESRNDDRVYRINLGADRWACEMYKLTVEIKIS